MSDTSLDFIFDYSSDTILKTEEEESEEEGAGRGCGEVEDGEGGGGQREDATHQLDCDQVQLVGRKSYDS